MKTIMRLGPIIVLAVWVGVVFGIVEGVVLCVSRQYPMILAPYKTSAHVLWVAPLLDVALFVTAAVIGGSILCVLGRRLGKDLSGVAFVGFIVLGMFAVLNSVRLMHPVAALILSLGLAVGPRSIWVRLAQTVISPRAVRWLAVTPFLLLAIWGGIRATDTIVEAYRSSRLPRAADDALNVLVLSARHGAA